MSPRHIPHATHAAPLPGFTITPCCAVRPTDLRRHHVVTPDLGAVTCRGNPVSPVRELAAITLTGTRRPGTRAHRFLPHGDEDGHVYDDRCALCTADVRSLADQITAAVIAAFPSADVRNLQTTRPSGPVPFTLPGQAGPLRTLVNLILTTTPRLHAWNSGFIPHGPPDGHLRDRRCALCVADVDALATAVEDALSAALPGLVEPVRSAPASEGAS